MVTGILRITTTTTTTITTTSSENKKIMQLSKPLRTAAGKFISNGFNYV